MSMPHNRAVLTIALSWTVAPLGLAQPFVAERIMGTWETVPGTDGLTWTGVYGAPQLDASGGVLFTGSWQDGEGVSGIRAGVFYGSPGQVSPVIVTHTPAPGAPWAPPFNEFNYWPVLQGYALAESGFLALKSTINNPDGSPTTFSGGLYAGSPGSLEPVTFYGLPGTPTPGQPAPGAPDQITAGMFNPLSNSLGQVAYRSGLYPPVSVPFIVNAITAGTPDNLSLIAAEGLPVPPIPGATYTTNVANLGFSLGDGGHVAFYANFEGEGIPRDEGFAFLRWHADEGTVIVLRAGDAAPGVGAGVDFTGIGIAPGISSAGSVEFIAGIAGPGIDADNNTGVWTGQPGGLQLALQEGDVTPGLAPSEEVGNLGFATIVDTGSLMVYGSVRGAGIDSTNDQAIWFGPAGGMEAVFREGTQAHGLPDGVVFTFDDPDISADLSYPDYALNDSEDLLIIAGLAGPGVTPENNAGLWFRDGETGDWSLVLRTGDVLDGRVVAPEAINGVGASTLLAFHREAGYSQSFSDAGLLALRVKFTDGSEGIYRLSVPEAGTTAFLMLALVLTPMRRPRHATRAGVVSAEGSDGT